MAADANGCCSFQRVLDRSGISDALREYGVREGDDVTIGMERREIYRRGAGRCCVGERVFTWSDDQSEKSLFESFKLTQKAERRALRGSARWPHST